MIKEDIYCGLIWDSEFMKFVGIFTIRDFLNLIRVTYEKLKTYLQTNGSWTSIKALVQQIFQRNNINIEDLDVIMESVENNDKKSEKSEIGEMDIIEENHNNLEHSSLSTNGNVENSLNNYKEFFKIFEYLNISDYLSDIQPVSKQL